MILFQVQGCTSAELLALFRHIVGAGAGSALSFLGESGTFSSFFIHACTDIGLTDLLINLNAVAVVVSICQSLLGIANPTALTLLKI
jgi:uncharacterized protein YwlG (UPF0340 family)